MGFITSFSFSPTLSLSLSLSLSLYIYIYIYIYIYVYVYIYIKYSYLCINTYKWTYSYKAHSICLWSLDLFMSIHLLRICYVKLDSLALYMPSGQLFDKSNTEYMNLNWKTMHSQYTTDLRIGKTLNSKTEEESLVFLCAISQLSAHLNIATILHYCKECF